MVSGLVSGYSNWFELEAPTATLLDYSVSEDTLITLTMQERNRWKHAMGNLNLQHTFGDGQVVNFNVDYLRYHNANPSQYQGITCRDTQSVVRTENQRIEKNTPIDIWVGKVDHSVNLGKLVTLESGAKGTFSYLINEVEMEERTGETWVTHPGFSSYADLSEDILALYSAVKISAGSKTSVNAGVRYERTRT